MNGGEQMLKMEVQLKNATHVDRFVRTETGTFHFAHRRNLETLVASFTSYTFLLLLTSNIELH